MARYGELRFLRADEVRPRRSGDLVFRQRRWDKLLALLVFAALPAGFFLYPAGSEWFGYKQELPPALCYVIGAVLLIFLWIAWRIAKASFGSANWLLLSGLDGIYLKYRSYLNAELPADDPVVVFLPKAEIKSLRGHRVKAWKFGASAGEEERASPHYFIEIRLQDDELLDLVTHLRAERALEPGAKTGIKTLARHYPVRVLPDGWIEVDWAGMSPGLKRALKILGSSYALEDFMVTEQARYREMDRRAREDRLLELAERGRTMDAVKLAKLLYGHDTTEAKTFVDGLLKR